VPNGNKIAEFPISSYDKNESVLIVARTIQRKVWQMPRVLMLASFGLEIVECGGALALHVQAGDYVHAAVLLSRPQSRPQITEAAGILGIENVEFLGFPYGEFTLDVAWKEQIVELVRRVRPDIVIHQDPHHAQHDLDPDRRLIALLYTEALCPGGARLACPGVWAV